MEIIFWICLLAVGYAYFGYPLILAVIGKFRNASVDLSISEPAENPPVTMIIPAHNEEAVIERKLENALALEYPGELELLVVSDGSTDRTAEIAQTFVQSGRITFIDLPIRKGKAIALNTAIEAAAGDIIVFSDASIMLDKHVVRELLRPFQDPIVGCVSGEDRIDGEAGEGLYGRYELYLRRKESDVASIVGASGSIYAQRKELVPTFPEGVAPDFLSVLNTVRNGYRAIAEPKAIGFMTATADASKEFQRKVRTVVRGIAALLDNRDLLNPFSYPMFAMFLISHKLMRWLVPIFLVGLLGSSVWLVEGAFYRLAVLAQVAFYVTGLAVLIGPDGFEKFVPGRIAAYFLVVNSAILVGWFSYIGGTRPEIWNPTQRGPSS